MKVSIITINYNDLAGLTKTLDSVERILHQDVELIVVDGNSNDGSDLLIKNTDFISKYTIEPDQGIYDAMNKGINVAVGELVIFMNSGDEFNYSFSFHDFLSKTSEVDCSNSIIYADTIRSLGNLSFYDKAESFSAKGWKRGTPCHQSIFIPLLLLKNNMFDTSLSLYADAKQILACASLAKKVIYYDGVIARYAVGGASSQGVRSLRRLLSNIEEYCYVFNIQGWKKTPVFFKRIIKNTLILLAGYKFYYAVSYIRKNK